MSKDLYKLAYARNIGIVSSQEQQRLARSTVAIAGVGGIGSNTAIILARMGVGKFRLADFDNFDYSNINRQYGAFLDTVGQPKVEVLAKELQRINPVAEVTIEHAGFTADNAEQFLSGADIAVDAIDFYSIDAHLEFHRQARKRNLYVLMGSPVGFSACLQIFDPKGMSLEEYCGIQGGMLSLEKQLRYACGVVPNLAHIEYFDVSRGSSNTNFLKKTGPSLACATTLAASLVASEAAIILLDRRKPKAIPYTFQFDPYTFRYEKVWLEKGMDSYDPDRALSRIQDRSSLIPLVMKYLYKRKKARRAKINGAELYYEIEGQGDHLLLLAPLGADSSFWTRQIQELSQSFTVITFDGRGTGLSSTCDPDVSTRLMAQDAIGLLEKLGVQHTNVLGLALGGLVAQQIAVMRPEMIDRMILASTYARADEHLRNTVLRWQQLALDEGMEALFDACLPALFSPAYVEDSTGDVDKLRTYFHLNVQDPKGFIYQSTSGLRHDSIHELSKISCPTMVLYGEADQVVRRELAEELAASIRNSAFEVMSGAPHFMAWEMASSFNREVIRFLTKKDHDLPEPSQTPCCTGIGN